jgi:hypothetical protein
LDASALVACPSDCQAIPASMTLYLTGQCEDAFSTLFLGQDSTLDVLAVVEWDSDNGCFILTVEGSSSAPSDCQLIEWRGYGGGAGPAGTYTRLCGADGGCSANAGVSTLTLT